MYESLTDPLDMRFLLVHDTSRSQEQLKNFFSEMNEILVKVFSNSVSTESSSTVSYVEMTTVVFAGTYIIIPCACARG